MTTRIIPDLTYFRPKTINEAVSLLARYSGKAKILAGGTDLLVALKQRKESCRRIINIKGIRDLDYIAYNKKGLRIGALTSLRSIELSKVIQEKYPILSEAARQMACVQVRNMGTIGGNLCNASPSADLAPPLLALNAKVRTISKKGVRDLLLEDFFVGPGKTALDSNAMLTEIQVPGRPPNTGTAFLKVGRSALDLSKVNVGVALTLTNGVCKNVRIAIGAVAPIPIRARKAEENLRDKKPKEELIERTAELAANETKPITDVRSTVEWRREASKILVKRAINTAIKIAKNWSGVKND